MKLQSGHDQKFTSEIVYLLDQRFKTGEKTEVAILNVPHSTVDTYGYGEYAATCMSADWCLQAALNRRTDKAKKVIINPKKYDEKNTLVLTYDNKNNKIEPFKK